MPSVRSDGTSRPAAEGPTRRARVRRRAGRAGEGSTGVGGLERDPGADDPGPDDEQVEGLGLQPLEDAVPIERLGRHPVHVVTVSETATRGCCAHTQTTSKRWRRSRDEGYERTVGD